MEDFVTWSHSSAIKKHVMEYNEMVGVMIMIIVIFLIKLIIKINSNNNTHRGTIMRCETLKFFFPNFLMFLFQIKNFCLKNR